MAELNHTSPCFPLRSFIVELWHCNYKTFINDAKYLFKFLEVQFKTNFFCRDVKSISSTNTGMNICLKFNGARFLGEEERSLHSRLTGNSALPCFVFTLESAQPSAAYKTVTGYLSSPNGRAAATEQQTAGFRLLNMVDTCGVILSWGCDWRSHWTFFQLHLIWSSDVWVFIIPFALIRFFLTNF